MAAAKIYRFWFAALPACDGVLFIWGFRKQAGPVWQSCKALPNRLESAIGFWRRNGAFQVASVGSVSKPLSFSSYQSGGGSAGEPVLAFRVVPECFGASLEPVELPGLA